MYYEYDEDFKEKNSKEECQRRYTYNMQEMAYYDNELQSLYEEKCRLENRIADGECYEEYNELLNKIESYENNADYFERNSEYWRVALDKFYSE